MTDRRFLASNGRVAHVSLRGQVTADRFVEGRVMGICQPVAPLFANVGPNGGTRDRELVLNQAVRVLDMTADWVFGVALRDGYVGYLRRDAVALCDKSDVTDAITHVVHARQSYLLDEPVLKNSREIVPVSFGSAFTVTGRHDQGRWAEVTRFSADGTRSRAFVPAAHLRPVTQPEADPIDVAERFLGTPYHWGGNSGFGIDCSGLVQAALMACAIPCPADSDLQEAAFDDANGDYRRGDLLFWQGHVAMVVDDQTLIHANGHDMAVAYEGITAAIARIESQGEGPVTAHKRP